MMKISTSSRKPSLTPPHALTPGWVLCSAGHWGECCCHALWNDLISYPWEQNPCLIRHLYPKGPVHNRHRVNTCWMNWVRPWANYRISLSFTFLLSKAGPTTTIIIVNIYLLRLHVAGMSGCSPNPFLIDRPWFCSGSNVSPMHRGEKQAEVVRWSWWHVYALLPSSFCHQECGPDGWYSSSYFGPWGNLATGWAKR